MHQSRMVFPAHLCHALSLGCVIYLRISSLIPTTGPVAAFPLRCGSIESWWESSSDAHCWEARTPGITTASPARPYLCFMHSGRG